MMKLLFVLLPLLAASCSNTNTAFTDKVKDADSVAINYYRGDGTMDTVVQVRIVKDPQLLNQLTAFIAAAPAEHYKCGYDGSLHYFKKGAVLQDVDFRMNDVQCMHFSFVLSGKLYAAKLPPEARQWLETVKK